MSLKNRFEAYLRIFCIRFKYMYYIYFRIPKYCCVYCNVQCMYSAVSVMSKFSLSSWQLPWRGLAGDRSAFMTTYLFGILHCVTRLNITVLTNNAGTLRYTEHGNSILLTMLSVLLGEKNKV